jgi:hypothetical protein
MKKQGKKSIDKREIGVKREEIQTGNNNCKKKILRDKYLRIPGGGKYLLLFGRSFVFGHLYFCITVIVIFLTSDTVL